MNSEFASSNLTIGQINAIVKKLGGHEAALKFLRGEITVSEPTKKYREENGVVYFSVTSDGTTGAQWIERLTKKGFRVGDYAKQLLLSDDFKTTNNVITEIAVLEGMLFGDKNRTTKNIRIEADKRNLSKPNAEVSCLIREMFTDKELEVMGLYYIVIMHEAIKDSGGGSGLLSVNRDDDGSWLNTYYDKPDDQWDREDGFAFAVSQVDLKSQSFFALETLFFDLGNYAKVFF